MKVFKQLVIYNSPSIRYMVFFFFFFYPGIALDKVLFSTEKYLYFSYFSMKTYVMGTHEKRFAEVLLMSIHGMFPSRNKKNHLPVQSYVPCHTIRLGYNVFPFKTLSIPPSISTWFSLSNLNSF